jgi:hypothetical protein
VYWKHVSAIKRRPNVPVVSLEKPLRHSTDVKTFAFAFSATINEFHKSQSPLFCTLIAENDARYLTPSSGAATQCREQTNDNVY